MFDLSTSTKLNVILGLLLALLIFLIVLLCRKGGEGYKDDQERQLEAAKQLIGAPKDEAKQLTITLREAALARRLAAAKEKELAAAKAN